MTTNAFPPTEPQSKPQVDSQSQARQQATPRRTQISGRDLSIDTKKRGPAIEQSHWYWIGALPGLPVEGAHFGGQCFPKMEERVSKSSDGSTIRSPVIGALVRLTADNVKRIRDRLPRTVVRWREEEPEEREDRIGLAETTSKGGSGKSVDAVTGDHQRRRGHLITIPTEAEIAAKRAAGRAANLYLPRAGDEPASRYLFALLCHNQEQPGRGDHYPAPLETTGLEWPGQLD